MGPTGWRMVLASLLPAVLATSTPPTFVLDLSAPAESRWAGALALIAAEHAWEDSWEIIFSEHNATLFDHLSASDFASLGSALNEHFPTHAAELKGISAEFTAVYQQTVTYEYLAAWVYFHELAHTDIAGTALDARRECTGIVAQDAHGVHHVANMDQSPEAVRNVTLAVTFVRSPKGSPALLSTAVRTSSVITCCGKEPLSLEKLLDSANGEHQQLNSMISVKSDVLFR